MSNWKTYKLGDFADVQTGPFGSQLHAADYVETGIPSIMPVNIVDHKIEEVGIARIKAEDAKRLSKYLVTAGDIVFSRRGEIHRRALITDKESGWLCGTGCLRARLRSTDEVDPQFLYFYLGIDEVRDWLYGHAVGTSMPNLNSGILSNLPIALPDLPTQRRIAEILSALDDKIELNRRMNQTLEQMAQTLFRQYFVDGIDEENLPEGWKVGKLSDVSKNIRKTVNPKELQEECKYVGLEHIPRKSIALTDWSTSIGVESQKYRFEQNHILFGKLRPYFHKVILAPFEGICSTDILVIEPLKDYMLAFCLLHYSSEEVVQYSNQLSHGTRMPRADWKGLSGYEIAIPPTELFIKFNNLILPSLHKIKANIEEIQTLTHLRDTLLPKLMSGEIDVMQTQAHEEHEPVLS